MFNQKRFANMVLIIVIVLLIGAMGYVKFVKKSTVSSVDDHSKLSEQKRQQAVSSTINNISSQIRQSSKITDWETYRNEEYGFEVEYPVNIFQLDKNTNTLSHTLKDFHKYSAKDGSDLGLANDISIIFKKENDRGCNWLETELNLKSLGISFEFKNIKGVKYETGAEGEGVVYYCVKNKDSQNIFLIERWFLNTSYSTELHKQNDYIDGEKQEKLFNQILNTFKFNKQMINLNTKLNLKLL